MVIHSKDVISKLPVNQILSAIIENGLELDANFIHIEVLNDLVRVKYRIAGSLIKGPEISKKRFNSLSDKIKSLANIQIGFIDLIAGGKFKYLFNGQGYSIRVYIMPTISGEKITFKIQNDAPVSDTLKELGFWGNSLETIEKAINLKNGLILVTGPNDAGKSRTIATLLESISDLNVSIATLEDPVEYKISRANQTQINHKTNLDFNNGLKILLKQDNDVIMLSELTDSSIINQALEMVANKKLIISSMNVESAVETITRLLDYGISPASLAYGLRLVINQRLIKRLCSNCKQYTVINKVDSEKINKLFGLKNSTNMKYIHDLEVSYSGFLSDEKKISPKSLSTSETRIKKIWTNNPKGCVDCSNTGYKGRVAIAEILVNSSEIERLIITKSQDLLINKQAVREGMVNYLIDGLLKVLIGETTIDEIIGLTKTNYLT